MKKLRAAAAAACVLYGCSHEPAPSTPVPIVRLAPGCAQRPVSLLVVGDSLARGWGASSPRTSFASLVYADVRREHPETTLHNFGIPGATTDEIAAKELPHVSAGDCSVIVVIAGANDVQKLYSPHRFRDSYRTLLGRIRNASPKAGLVVIGLPDVSLSPRIPWFLKGIESRLSRDANASVSVVAGSYGAAFVPMYDLSHREAYRSGSLLSADGIHPNDRGYRIMAKAAMPSIMTVLGPDERR